MPLMSKVAGFILRYYIIEAISFFFGYLRPSHVPNSLSNRELVLLK